MLEEKDFDIRKFLDDRVMEFSFRPRGHQPEDTALYFRKYYSGNLKLICERRIDEAKIVTVPISYEMMMPAVDPYKTEIKTRINPQDFVDNMESAIKETFPFLSQPRFWRHHVIGNLYGLCETKADTHIKLAITDEIKKTIEQLTDKYGPFLVLETFRDNVQVNPKIKDDYANVIHLFG